MFSVPRLSTRLCLGLALVVCMAAVILTGCDSNPSGSSVSGTTTGTNTPTPTTATAVYGNIIGRIVTTTGAAAGISGVTVTLRDAGKTALKTYTTNVDGTYVFTNIQLGIYLIEATKETYESGATLVDLKSTGTTEAKDLILAQSPTGLTGIPTVDLTGNLLIKAGQPLSVAVISADSGQSTVTDINGKFTLKNIASGSRTLTVQKPGTSPATLKVLIEGRAGMNTADLVKFLNRDFAPALVAGRWVANLGDIPISFSLHGSGALAGTIQKIDLVGLKKTIIPNYPFEIWAFDGERYGFYQTVISDANGEWFVDNIPSLSDNGYHWLAAATGTIQVASASAAGLEYYLTNVNYPKPNFTVPGYIVESDKTTIMDIVVPIN